MTDRSRTGEDPGRRGQEKGPAWPQVLTVSAPPGGPERPFRGCKVLRKAAPHQTGHWPVPLQTRRRAESFGWIHRHIAPLTGLPSALGRAGASRDSGRPWWFFPVSPHMEPHRDASSGPHQSHASLPANPPLGLRGAIGNARA